MSRRSPESSSPETPGRSLFTLTVLSAAVLYLVLRFALPYLSMWVNDAPAPHPVPSALTLIYALVFLVGVLVYVTSSEERIRDFTIPVVRFLRDEGEGPTALARKAVLAAIPVLVGLAIWRAGAPGVESATTIRVQHPTMPGKYETLVNPFRATEAATGSDSADRSSAMPAAHGKSEKEVLREGIVLYQTNCRPCHGVAAGGDGPMADFFRLQPANFRDPGYIATVVEPYAFWRVTEGGLGLPGVATPWESAMPVWKTDLTEEERWKVLLAEYHIAGVEPRKPEKLE